MHVIHQQQHIILMYNYFFFFLSLTLILYRYKVFKLEPQVLIEGVLFRARYLGSTQLICEGQPTKTTRMMQAEEAVARIKVSEHIELGSLFHRFSLIFSRKLSICLSWILNAIGKSGIGELEKHTLRIEISFIGDFVEKL